MRRACHSGYTLVEMSIVLVIIAALAGAILMGQTLFRAADLNSVVSDAARYTAAFTDFRDKYTALPGDMPTAQSFWGTPLGGCPEGVGSGTEVCNGNGDGLVCAAGTASNIAELRSQWIELANAGFISGSYRYRPATTGTWQAGENTPVSALNQGTFQFYFATCPLGDGLYPSVPPYAIHWLSFGRLNPAAGIFLPLLKGEEAMNIDRKMDNGMPGTGTIRASRNATAGGNTPACQTSAVPDTAEYSLTGTDPVCYLMFALTQ